MAKKTDLNIDDKIFYKLLSLECALRTSVLDPLIMHSDLYDARKLHSPLSFAIFYAEDYGEGHIRHRIDVASDDIKFCVLHHECVIDELNEVNGAFENENRHKVFKQIMSLVYKTNDYLNFVSCHQKKVLDDFFLYFPRC